MATVLVAIPGLAEEPWTHYINVGGQLFSEPVQTKVEHANFIQAKLCHEGINDLDGALMPNQESKYVLIYHSGKSARTTKVHAGGEEFLNERVFHVKGLKPLKSKCIQEYETQPKTGYIAFFKVLNHDSFSVEWQLMCPETKNIRKYVLCSNPKISSGFEMIYLQDQFE